METKKELKRTHQCKKCPWKVSTNPFDIPDGYCEMKHKALEETIAREVSFDFCKPIRIMACHHSKDTDENAEHCVGWLVNQLGEGNNIPLRISMMRYSNSKDLKVVGKQHTRFEDTLPENKIAKQEEYFGKLLDKLKQDPQYELKQEFGKLLMIHINDFTPEQKTRYEELKELLKEPTQEPGKTGFEILEDNDTEFLENFWSDLQ